jgi:hypothetical protein
VHHLQVRHNTDEARAPQSESAAAQHTAGCEALDPGRRGGGRKLIGGSTEREGRDASTNHIQRRCDPLPVVGNAF